MKLEHRGLVVHHQHAAGSRALSLRRARCSSTRRSAARRGQQRCGSGAGLAAVSTTMWPPCSCTMPCTVARPMPLPLPTSLVVKNGSNMRSSTSARMPGPVSATESSTKPPAKPWRQLAHTAPARRAARTATRQPPPPPIASRALIARLSSTWSSCTGSTSTARTCAVELGAQLERRRQRAAQQLQRLAHRCGRASSARRAALAAAEGEHLLDQVARALRRGERLLEVARELGVAARLGALRRRAPRSP